MNDEQKGFDWLFFGWWVLGMGLFLGVGTILGFLSMWSVYDLIETALGEQAAVVLAGGLFGATVGAGTGIGQWVALRQKQIPFRPWVLASVAGTAVGLIIGFILIFVILDNPDNPDPISGLLFGIFIGLPMGFGQWLVLRRITTRAILWPLITLIAFSLAFLAGFTLNGGGTEWAVMIGIGLMAAILSGLGMSWLLAKESPVRPQLVMILGIILLGLALSACQRGARAPQVSFASPADKAEVTGAVQVEMTAENFTVEPAGDVHDGAGHLHIMVDVPCLSSGEVIPKDDQHRHFGDGSLETALELPPGEHSLCLQAADGAHVALEGDGLTDTITVIVRE